MYRYVVVADDPPFLNKHGQMLVDGLINEAGRLSHVRVSRFPPLDYVIVANVARQGAVLEALLAAGVHNFFLLTAHATDRSTLNKMFKGYPYVRASFVQVGHQPIVDARLCRRLVSPLARQLGQPE